MGGQCCAAREEKSSEKGDDKLYVRLNNEKEVEKFKKDIERQFTAADKDKNKSLSFDELFRLTTETNKRLGIKAPNKDDLKRLFNEGDVNKDGKLSLPEYTNLMFKHLKELADIERASELQEANKKQQSK